MRPLFRLAAVGVLVLTPLAAHALTGKELLADPDSEAHSSYVSGAIGMLSQVLSAEGQSDKAACVKAWHSNRRDNVARLLRAFESYPDMAVEVTLYQLLRQECDFETLKVEKKAS